MGQTTLVGSLSSEGCIWCAWGCPGEVAETRCASGLQRCESWQSCTRLPAAANARVGVSSREDAHLLQTSAFTSRQRFLGESLLLREHEAVPLGSCCPDSELVWEEGRKVWIWPKIWYGAGAENQRVWHLRSTPNLELEGINSGAVISGKAA